MVGWRVLLVCRIPINEGESCFPLCLLLVSNCESCSVKAGLIESPLNRCRVGISHAWNRRGLTQQLV